MDNCLSRSDITGLMSGGLDEKFTAAAFEHIDRCESCRSAVLSSEEYTRAASRLRTRVLSMSDCLDFETLAACIDGTLEGETRAAADVHLNYCSDCREDVDYLRQAESLSSLRDHRAFEPARNTRRQASWWFMVLAPVAVAGCALILFFVYSRPLPLASPRVAHRAETPSANGGIAYSVKADAELHPSSPHQQQPAPRVALRDGEYVVESTHDGNLRLRGSHGGTVALSQGVAEAVRMKLRTGKASSGPIILAQVPSDVLRGNDQDADLRPRALVPSGRNVLGALPTLSWDGPERVDGYQVEVLTQQGRLIWSTAANKKRARVTVPLKRGETYLWRVGSRIDENAYFSKPAVIRVLGNKDAEFVSGVLKTYETSHLVKGTVLERYGLYDEAMIEFRKLAALNPRSKLANRLINGLRQEMEASK